MIRLLLSLPVILILVGGFAVYKAYGEVEPCRVLAVERARRAEAHSIIPLGGIIEPWQRMETSQLSMGQCTSDLLDSWGERLSKSFS